MCLAYVLVKIARQQTAHDSECASAKLASVGVIGFHSLRSAHYYIVAQLVCLGNEVPATVLRGVAVSFSRYINLACLVGRSLRGVAVNGNALSVAVDYWTI